MGHASKEHRLGAGPIRRSGLLRADRDSRSSLCSGRLISAVAGRKASHDGVAMCLLRKDFAYAMPLRREQRVARNRRVLVLLWILAGLWWLCGRLLF